MAHFFLIPGKYQCYNNELVLNWAKWGVYEKKGGVGKKG
jgi:hypothetical protein